MALLYLLADSQMNTPTEPPTTGIYYPTLHYPTINYNNSEEPRQNYPPTTTERGKEYLP